MYEDTTVALSALTADDARDLINLAAEKLEEKIHDAEHTLMRYDKFDYPSTRRTNCQVKLDKCRRLHKAVSLLRASLRDRDKDPRETLRQVTVGWDELGR